MRLTCFALILETLGSARNYVFNWPYGVPRLFLFLFSRFNIVRDRGVLLSFTSSEDYMVLREGSILRILRRAFRIIRIFTTQKNWISSIRYFLTRIESDTRVFNFSTLTQIYKIERFHNTCVGIALHIYFNPTIVFYYKYLAQQLELCTLSDCHVLFT